MMAVVRVFALLVPVLVQGQGDHYMCTGNSIPFNASQKTGCFQRNGIKTYYDGSFDYQFGVPGKPIFSKNCPCNSTAQKTLMTKIQDAMDVLSVTRRMNGNLTTSMKGAADVVFNAVCGDFEAWSCLYGNVGSCIDTDMRFIGPSSPKAFYFKDSEVFATMECFCQVCPALKTAGIEFLINAYTLDPNDVGDMTKVMEFATGPMRTYSCPAVNPLKCAKKTNPEYCPTFVHEFEYEGMPEAFKPLDITADKGLMVTMLQCEANGKSEGDATEPKLPERCIDFEGKGPGIKTVGGEEVRITKLGTATRNNTNGWKLHNKEVASKDMCPMALLNPTTTTTSATTSAAGLNPGTSSAQATGAAVRVVAVVATIATVLV